MKPDYSKLSPELQEKIKGWEANNPANKQLVKLNDIASIMQDISNVIDYRGEQSDKTLKELGTVLTDAREQLVAMNAKEAPETPDTSQPVIDAISKLEKALTSAVSAQKAPIVNVPKADAPVVNVDAPNVTLDTKEIAKLLKTDIPQAFEKAVKAITIPENDDTETNNLLQQLSEQLGSIDTGVRLKPQAPTSMAVTGALTNTELRATPVPISGTVTTTAPDIQNIEMINALRSLLQAVSVPSWYDPTTNTLRVGTTAVTVSSGTVTTVTTVGNLTNFGSNAADVMARDTSINTWANVARRTIT